VVLTDDHPDTRRQLCVGIDHAPRVYDELPLIHR